MPINKMDQLNVLFPVSAVGIGSDQTVAFVIDTITEVRLVTKASLIWIWYATLL